MSFEEGIWQRNWPRLPQQCLYAMQSSTWGACLLNWPVGETLEGAGERDFSRLGALLWALDRSIFGEATIYAPRRWISSEETTRTAFYKKQWRDAMDAQKLLLAGWTPGQGVQPFMERRAAGSPGHWNYLQPFAVVGRKRGYRPKEEQGQPNHAKLLEN